MIAIVAPAGKMISIISLFPNPWTLLRVRSLLRFAPCQSVEAMRDVITRLASSYGDRR
jgi:hypothetical protein